MAKLVVPEDAPVDNKGRIIDEQWALNVANTCQGKVATVTQASVEDKKMPAPLPFSLLDLQAQMSRQHGIDAEKTLAALSSSLPELADALVSLMPNAKSRAFDDSKVSAHTAIIPTAARVDVNSMTADERVVYLAIVKQYLAQFLPEKCYQAAQVMFGVVRARVLSHALQNSP